MKNNSEFINNILNRIINFLKTLFRKDKLFLSNSEMNAKEIFQDKIENNIEYTAKVEIEEEYEEDDYIEDEQLDADEVKSIYNSISNEDYISELYRKVQDGVIEMNNLTIMDYMDVVSYMNVLDKRLINEIDKQNKIAFDLNEKITSLKMKIKL